MNTNSQRKYYIDNLRILCILLLLPFHTAMIFNGFGEPWYIHSKTNMLAANILNLSTYPWWMSGLFTLAGISTVYALKHRTWQEYLKERFAKLFIPLLSALIFLIPIQTYLADKFYNNYSGSYFEHLKVFFSITDFSGYDGHFTPAHTWFILYLFIISLVCLPLIVWYKNKNKKISEQALTIPKLIPMFLIPLILRPVLDIGGKSLTEFACWFLLGYFILSLDNVQDRLKKNANRLGLAWISLMILMSVMYLMDYPFNILWDIINGFFSWIGILAIIGLSKRYLNFNNGFTKYFVKAEFPIFLFHQTIIVIVAYFIVPIIDIAPLQYVIILVLSSLATIALYEVTRRFVVFRKIFAIKK